MSAGEAVAALEQFDGLIDWDRLNGWLAAHDDAPGSGPVTAVQRLRGGLANAVFRIERGDTAFVLRRPPAKVRDGQNATMLREARILKALDGTDVPHPQFYIACDDPEVIGACFYLMEPLEGRAVTGELKGGYAEDPAWRRTMGEALVRAAAALAAVDPVAVGLGDLGKPENWHERQVARWRSQLEGYAATPGYDPGELPHVDAVGAWLQANLPADRRIGLVHGDLQFPNVMFSQGAPRISGIVDWELGSLGDPMLDLGWILSSWFEPGDPEGKKPMVTPWDGFPTRAALIDLYCGLTGRDPAAVPWFFALACYKLACLLEGTYARSKAGQVPEDIGKSVHGYASWLMNKAMQIIAA